MRFETDQISTCHAGRLWGYASLFDWGCGYSQAQLPPEQHSELGTTSRELGFDCAHGNSKIL